MKWFTGSIPEAIALSRSKKAIFVVFVEGTDDTSQKISDVIENDPVSSTLEGGDFVSVKLQGGTETYKQFAQIYKLVPVPSVFFISLNGTPVEVVAENLDADALLSRAQKALQQHKDLLEGSHVSNSPSTSTSTLASSPASQPNGTSEVAGPSSSTTGPSLTAVLDKFQKENQLVERQRILKAKEEEEEKERQREIERCVLGLAAQKVQKQKEDQEIKAALEERKREKAEDVSARERILKQIEQDRVERSSRYHAEKSVEEEKRREMAAAKQSQDDARSREMAAARSTIARLQFRLPDGSSYSQQFSPDQTLGEVRQHIQNNLTLPFRQFTLTTTFPKREFSTQDDQKTLRDSELCPSASLLIVPNSSIVPRSSSYGSFTDVFWWMFSPLLKLVSFLGSVLNIRGPSQGRDFTRSASGGAAASGSSQSSNPDPSRQRSTSDVRFRRQGNIHRLTDRRDSDDENNTWNGNSTQQM